MECKKDYKAIVEFHLKYHNMTFKQYKKKYPDAPITDPYNCEVCTTLVDDSQSKRGKYCKPCAKKVKDFQIRENARKHNNIRKRQLEKAYGEANIEHGMTIDENNPSTDRVRVDPTHSAWDFIPDLQNVSGTYSEKSLDINKKTGRIKQAEWLHREINKIKETKRRR